MLVQKSKVLPDNNQKKIVYFTAIKEYFCETKEVQFIASSIGNIYK